MATTEESQSGFTSERRRSETVVTYTRQIVSCDAKCDTDRYPCLFFVENIHVQECSSASLNYCQRKPNDKKAG